MTIINDDWFECLDEEFKWLKAHQDNPQLLDVVNRIIENEIYSYITEVFESSIWAVCHAYIDYRLGTSFLSPNDLEYTRTRSGVIGCKQQQNGVMTIATIRDFLEFYDIGFKYFMLGHIGPPAA